MKKIILASMVFSSVVCAQDMSGFYLGAGVGSTSFSDDGYTSDIGEMVNILTGDSATTATNEPDGQTYKFIAGYQFNRVIAVEGQYTQYAPIKIENSASFLEHELGLSSFTVSANLGYTFDNGLRPFGTLGLGTVSLDESDSTAGTALRIGAGLEYNVRQLPGLSLRAAYETDYYSLEFIDKEYTQSIGSFYVAANYKF
ncbi:porin family protein [Vibrio sp. JPW-9-11-11]|uniref:outer membrane protein n=1 Tax=Vibrio sp. JPW-9-11-11 TaxID=1416532 RepID=UPI001592E5B6|nr:porin family protein [Vibrio sp. JPW-9-11-11]NVD08024.1 porin family protein [Vibrio sp. JPW-9-11-11]